MFTGASVLIAKLGHSNRGLAVGIFNASLGVAGITGGISSSITIATIGMEWLVVPVIVLVSIGLVILRLTRSASEKVLHQSESISLIDSYAL